MAIAQERAAQILKASLDAGFDPVKLAALRSSRSTELRDQLANDIGAGDGNDERRRRFQLDGIESDMADDPYTGDAEQRRIGGIASALDAAATTTRPEIDDASHAVSSRNAFADFMKQKAGYKAQTSPEGVQALDAEARRKVEENAARASSAGGQVALQKARADSARTMLARLEAVHGELNTGNGPRQALFGGVDKLKAMVGLNNSASEYQKLRRATAVALAVAIQGSRPSDADAEAMAALLPDFNTPNAVAQNLFADTKSQLGEVSRTMSQGGGAPPPPAAQSNASESDWVPGKGLVRRPKR